MPFTIFPGNIIPERGLQTPNWAWIGLGANLNSPSGSPRATVRLAMARLSELSTRPARASSLWVSQPVDCPAGSPEFVNAVIAIAPAVDETPQALLQRLLALEQELGRRRTGLANEPRCLDLDLISVGDTRCHSASLVLPHPAAHQRAFVLFPLAEIDPSYRLPGHSRTVAQLCTEPAVSGQLISRIQE